jgi:23S rRNA pseudouridine955/2504/2580 synthase
MEKIEITSNDAPQRIDRFLSKYLNNAQNSVIYRLLRKNIVRVNGKRVKENTVLQVGDVVSVSLSNEQILQLQKEKIQISAEKLKLDIIYEDDEILLVDKPAGILTHPDKSEYKKTLATQVHIYLAHLCTRTFRPSPIQRLDKNTSGLVLFAKTYNSLQFYNEEMRNRTIEKKYLAIVHGKIEESGEIKGFLEKDEKKNKVFLSPNSSDNSKFVHTKYSPIETKTELFRNGFSLLEITLLTGRSHQIRVSMEYIGHPIVGDRKYTELFRNENIFETELFRTELFRNERFQLLHAYKIGLGDGRTFESGAQRIHNFWQSVV